MARDVSPTVVMEHLVNRQKGVLFLGDNDILEGGNKSDSETARKYFFCSLF